MTAFADNLVLKPLPRLSAAIVGSLAFHAFAIAAAIACHALSPALTSENTAIPVTIQEDVTEVSASSAITQTPLPTPSKPAGTERVRKTARRTAEISKARPAPSTPAAVDTDQSPAADMSEVEKTPGIQTASAISERPAGYRLGTADTPAPSYPLLARKKGRQGTVLLMLDVGVDGNTTNVTIASSSGDDSLDRAASETLAKWRLVPAIKDGRPVASRIEVPIAFVLK